MQESTGWLLQEALPGKAGGQPGNAFELVYADKRDRVWGNLYKLDPVLSEWIRQAAPKPKIQLNPTIWIQATILSYAPSTLCLEGFTYLQQRLNSLLASSKLVAAERCIPNKQTDLKHSGKSCLPRGERVFSLESSAQGDLLSYIRRQNLVLLLRALMFRCSSTCRCHCYGDVYSNPGLDLRQKQLMTAAFLVHPAHTGLEPAQL